MMVVTDVRQAGARVEELLDALGAAAEPRVRAQAEELVSALVEVYDAGLTRIVEIISEQLDDPGRFAELLAADELVASLLILHGLHPVPTAERVRAAIDGVRPRLGSHADAVDLIDVGGDGVVRLRLRVQGCRSTGATVRQAVQAAISAAAPEVTVEVEEVTAAPTGPQLIPVESLFRGRPLAASQ